MRKAFERHNPVPVDCYWNDERKMYCNKVYPASKHLFTETWDVWVEACHWMAESGYELSEEKPLANE